MKLFSKIVFTVSVLYTLGFAPLGWVPARVEVRDYHFRRLLDDINSESKSTAASSYIEPSPLAHATVILATLVLSMVQNGQWEDAFVPLLFSIILADAGLFFGSEPLAHFCTRVLAVAIFAHFCFGLGVMAYVAACSVAEKYGNCPSDGKKKGKGYKPAESVEKRAILLDEKA
ncbi:hypothetical protein AAVH_12443 [Aphelenchoides avenae]|nr:hypothetical protein AAVH_12443 [Aphelenchus avenae]